MVDKAILDTLYGKGFSAVLTALGARALSSLAKKRSAPAMIANNVTGLSGLIRTNSRVMAKRSRRAKSKRPSKRRKYVKKPTKKRVRSRVQSKLLKRVKTLEREVRSDMGIMIYRLRNVNVVLVAQGQAANGYMELNSGLTIESALNNLKYYDPATPGTLVTAAFTSGTFAKRVLIKRATLSVVLKCNYQTPVKLECYWVTCKVDSSTNINTAYTNGIADDPGAASSLNQLIHLRDSPQVHDLYQLKHCWTGLVLPGREKKFQTKRYNIEYDPATADTVTTTFRRDLKYVALHVRVFGVLGHDTVNAAEQGVMQGGIDYHADQEYIIEYNAGVGIKYHVISDDGDQTWTTAGVQSAMPVSDQIGYSVS